MVSAVVGPALARLCPPAQKLGLGSRMGFLLYTDDEDLALPVTAQAMGMKWPPSWASGRGVLAAVEHGLTPRQWSPSRAVKGCHWPRQSSSPPLRF